MARDACGSLRRREHVEDASKFTSSLPVPSTVGTGRSPCFGTSTRDGKLDPILDPVLDKAIQKSGRGFKVVLADKECEYAETFRFYMTTKLGNPHFTPELCAQESSSHPENKTRASARKQKRPRATPTTPY